MVVVDVGRAAVVLTAGVTRGFTAGETFGTVVVFGTGLLRGEAAAVGEGVTLAVPRARAAAGMGLEPNLPAVFCNNSLNLAPPFPLARTALGS